VLKPGGRIAYYNIFISHDAPEDLQRRYAQANPGQYSRAEQTALLRSARFVDIRETDVSAEFGRTLSALHDANGRHAAALRRQHGDDVFEERQQARRRGMDGVRAGVLKRSLFVATRPARLR
jgi:hypothetical protein